MTGPWERSEYQLSAADNDAIFWSEIEPTRLAGKPSRDHPLAVCQLGQAGSGKTASGRYLGSYLGPGEYIVADSDLYKPFHPEFDRLMREDDRAMTAATRLDGRTWMAKAQQYARDRGIDVLIDHTGDDLDYFRETLVPYTAAGYRVVVYALAVPEALSRQGILDRYHQQREQSGSGRLTIASKAAAGYRGLLDGAEIVEREHIADATVAIRRGLTVQYHNQIVEGRWEHPPGLRDAVERERAAPLPEAERVSFLARQAVLRQAVGAEFGPELDAIEQLAEPLLARTREQRLETPAAGGLTPGTVFARAGSPRPQPELGVEREPRSRDRGLGDDSLGLG